MPTPWNFSERYQAARAWSTRQAGRAATGVSRGARWTWTRVSAWPWKRIGIWGGGVFGVLVTSLVLFLAFADWNALRGPIGRIASNATGREIVLAGNLHVRPFSLTPEATIERLRIGNTQRFRDRGEFAEIGRARVAVALWPLLIGRFDVRELELERADVALYRTAEGQSNWASEREDAPNLPAIRELSVRDGRIQFVDEKRSMTLDATFSSSESARAEGGGNFTLNGDGSINGQAFKLDFAGAPLLNVRRDRPYAFRADVQAGATHIIADGSLRKPFDLSEFGADVRASGADLADLYYLLGLTLPNTPPYQAVGRVERAGSRYAMNGIRGRIGDSDISGQFVVSRQANDRPFFEGAFRSRALDWDDLMTVFGAPPSTAQGETASAEQRAEAAELRQEGRLLPDAKLDIRRVRNMDARVEFRADRVRAPNIPLRALSVNVALDNGLLTADPIDLGLTQGRVRGSAVINAREEVPRVNLDVRLTNARIETFIPAVSGSHPIVGTLAARVRLTGSGAAVREAAANANGNVTLVIPSGEVREAFAELTGINVTRGLGLLLSGDQDKINVRCGVANFEARNGILTAQNLVIDTETMLIGGRGTVNLRNETMDLQIEGQPKELRLLSVSAPINISGRLREPQIGVDAGEAVEQGGLAALLSTLVAPLAAVLPFVDAGLADDANCAALFAEARSEGARAPG